MQAAHKIKRELLRAKRELLDIKIDLKFAKLLRTTIKAGFSEDQPRDEDGKWTSAAAGQPEEASKTPTNAEGAAANIIERVFAAATRLAARKPSMSECVDLCLPLLLRPKSPGSDLNQFSYYRCLNACLGRLGQ